MYVYIDQHVNLQENWRASTHVNLLQPISKVPDLFPQWLTPVVHLPLIIIAYSVSSLRWVGIVFLLTIAICFLGLINLHYK